MQSRLLLHLVALAALAFLSVPDATDAQTSPAGDDPIPQPEGWVPFSAEFTRYDAAGRVAYVGRYHRASDGSTRQESSRPDGTRPSIGINNITRGLHYSNGDNRGWRNQPLALGPDGHQPEQIRRGMRGLTSHPDKVEGFEVYRYDDTRGTVSYRAPAINFFTVRSEDKFGDREAVYSNIQLGEPPRDLFEPPAGVAIMELKTPGGIVRRPGVKISLLADDGTSAKMTLIGDTRIDGGDATVALKDATTIAVKVSVEDQTWRVAIVKLFEVGRDTDGSPTEKPAGEFELQVGTAKDVSIAGHRVQVTVDRIGRRTR